MVMEVTGVDNEKAAEVLNKSKMRVKVAILMILADLDVEPAEELLLKAGGFLRKALSGINKG